MIFKLVGTWSRGSLRQFEFEEILSVAYLEAARVLEIRFDPDRGTASTYLSRYLYGFVQYRLLRDSGKRKTRTGWIEEKRRDPPAKKREAAPQRVAEIEEIVARMHPDLREAATRLAQGDSIEDLIDGPHFDGSGGLVSREIQIQELRQILQIEMARIDD